MDNLGWPTKPQHTQKQSYKRGEELLHNGKATAADVAQLQAQVASGKYDVVNASTQVEQYTLQLRQLLQLPDSVDFCLSSPSTNETAGAEATIPSADAVYKAALQLRPEIQSGKLAVEQSELSLKIAQGAYSPTISLTAGLQDSHMTGTEQNAGQQLRDNFNGQIGVSVTFPIFDNRQRKTQVEQAKIARLSSQIDLEDSQRQLRNTIDNYWLEANNNQQKYVASKSQLESQRASYALVSEQFRQGKQNIAQLLESRTALLSAELSLLQSQYSTLLNIALLHFYQNQSITF